MEIQVPTEGGFAERIMTALGDGGNAPVNWEQLAEVMGCVVDASRLQKTLAAKRDERIAALEAKILNLEATLEQRNFSYQGVWKEGRTYSPGMFVTFSGAMWHSNVFHNTVRPGDGNASWTLATKAGRDGKDYSK